MGVIEELTQRVDKLETEAGELRELVGKDKPQKQAYATITQLGTMYGCDRTTIHKWLSEMAGKGYNIETIRRSDNGPRYVNLAQFRRAVKELYTEPCFRPMGEEAAQ